MGQISSTDARALFTKTLIDVYQERIKPTGFLRTFFPAKESMSKNVAIEVERMGEKVAVDVVRGSDGNRNTFSRSTEKIFTPPLYKEYFDATELDLYDRVLGSQGNSNVDAKLFAALLDSVSDRLGSLQDKMERAQELQCANVLETGVVTLKNGDAIDYKRKATSLVNLGSGQYFVNAIDPFAKFEAGCVFMRTKGRSADSVFNAILGADALHDLLGNAEFRTRQNLFNLNLDAVQGPARNGVGAAFHGVVTAGSFKVQLWSYPQYYELESSIGSGSFTDTPYINPKKVYMFPLSPRFRMAFAQVPQLIDEPGQVPAQGAYLIGEYKDKRKTVHDFEIQCAPLAVPVAVDQIYTFQAVG